MFNYGEVQTVGFFKNRMLAGTWPWGQLWSWDFATRKWTLVKRLFSHPDVNALTDQERLDEPYVKKTGANQLGQRIVSMKKDRDALYVMTAAKDGYMKDFAAKAGLSEAQLNEYGAVHKFTTSGQFAVSLEGGIRAGDEFAFELTENYLRVSLNGRPIGSAVVKITDTFCLQRATAGDGLLGDWTGGMISCRSSDRNAALPVKSYDQTSAQTIWHRTKLHMRAPCQPQIQSERPACRCSWAS